MMLISLQSTLPTAITENAGPSSVYLWIGLIVAAAIFFFFLRRTDKIFMEDNKTAIVPEEAPAIAESKGHDEVHEEEAAAIAMALYLYKTDLHDKESFTITMQKVSRIYSPWSSKIYSLRQIPNRK